MILYVIEFRIVCHGKATGIGGSGCINTATATFQYHTFTQTPNGLVLLLSIVVVFHWEIQWSVSLLLSGTGAIVTFCVLFSSTTDGHHFL